MKTSAHILVIRLSAMGDVAMSIPVLLRLQKEYPKLKITVLTRKFFFPIFQDLSNVEVFEADVYGKHKGFFGLKRLAGELQHENISAVADLHNVLRSKILTFFFRWHGLPVKQLDKGRAEKKALTRSKNKIFKQLPTTPKRYADVFSALGFPVELSSKDILRKKNLSAKLSKFTGEKTEKWLGIAPFAQHASKKYPEDLMKEILEALQQVSGLKIFLFGGGKPEKAVLLEWETQFSNSYSVAGKFSFEEELQLISNLDVMLSMDSGNAHLAANLGIPVVTLWGLTHPFTGFAAFGQPKSNSLLPDLEKHPKIPTSIYGNTNPPPGYEDAMRSIAPGKVLNKLNQLLGFKKPV